MPHLECRGLVKNYGSRRVVDGVSFTVEPGQRVVVMDDLLATGGTMQTAVELLYKVGGDVRGAACLIELTFLKGRENVRVPIETLVAYDS